MFTDLTCFVVCGLEEFIVGMYMFRYFIHLFIILLMGFWNGELQSELLVYLEAEKMFGHIDNSKVHVLAEKMQRALNDQSVVVMEYDAGLCGCNVHWSHTSMHVMCMLHSSFLSYLSFEASYAKNLVLYFRKQAVAMIFIHQFQFL